MLNIFRETVTRNYYLFMRLIKGIKCVEEFFNSPVFTGDELNIIHQQNVYVVSIFISQLYCLVVKNRLYNLVGKLLGRYIKNPVRRFCRHNIVSYGIEKVCLSKSNTAVYK